MGCDKGLWETTFLMLVCSQSFFVSMPEGDGNNKKWKGKNRQMKDKIQPRQIIKAMTKTKKKTLKNKDGKNNNMTDSTKLSLKNKKKKTNKLRKNTTDKNQDLQKAEQLFERWKIQLWETKKNIVRGKEGGGNGRGENRVEDSSWS